MNSVSEMQQFGMIWPQCVARAWQDAQFRETLKRDPAGTLREAFQFNIPAGIDFQVVDSDEVLLAQQANTLRMIIPPIPDMDMREIALVGPDSSSGRHCFSFTFSVTGC
jgi:ribosomally synthesized peptide (two-chain TOMM family)